jgi:hypothetical protein
MLILCGCKEIPKKQGQNESDRDGAGAKSDETQSDETSDNSSET